MKSYFVYILLCADRSFYIGVTNDADKRVAEHQMGLDPRSYTFKRRPVKLVHCAEFRNVDEAIAWEKQIKGWSRAKKVAFISGNWKLLHDLAKCTQRAASFDSAPPALRSDTVLNVKPGLLP